MEWRERCAWNSSLMLEGSTPLELFRSRLDSARQYGKHRCPGGDILPQLHRVDLVQRVVGRVVPVEVARAVLIERNPWRAGVDGGLDIGSVGLAFVVPGNS